MRFGNHMRRCLGQLLVVLSILPWSATVSGAEIIRSWSTVRKEQGLMVNYVASIAHARDGSVWFGTAAGVSRFDGRSWVHHTTDDGLPGFLVTHVHVDDDGTVWAASGEGYPTIARPWLARYTNGVWTELELPERRMSVRQFLSVGEDLYAATRRGVLARFAEGARLAAVRGVVCWRLLSPHGKQ